MHDDRLSGIRSPILSLMYACRLSRITVPHTNHFDLESIIPAEYIPLWSREDVIYFQCAKEHYERRAMLHWRSYDSDPITRFDPPRGLNLRQNPRPSLTRIEHVAFIYELALRVSLGLDFARLFESWHFCWLANLPNLKTFILLMPEKWVAEK